MATPPSAVLARFLGWVSCLVAALLLTTVHLRLLALQPEPDPSVPGAAEKAPYAELAAGRRVRFVCVACSLAGSAATAVAGPLASAWLIWGSSGVVLAGVDAASTWSPRGLTRLVLGELTAALLLSAALAGDPRLIAGTLAGAGAVGGFFWLIWRAGAGLGFADVRLAVGLGALAGATAAAGAGPTAAVAAVLTAAVIGALTGIVHAMGRARHEPFPYGPALWLGAYACLVWAAAG